MTKPPDSVLPQSSSAEIRLSCYGCGFDVTDLLIAHPHGFAWGVAHAITSGLPCCGRRPSNDEAKSWARDFYA